MKDLEIKNECTINEDIFTINFTKRDLKEFLERRLKRELTVRELQKALVIFQNDFEEGFYENICELFDGICSVIQDNDYFTEED
jgi:hypothetical protein